MTLAEQLVDTWRISAEINLYLLSAIPDEGLAASSATGGRTVAEVFAHLHNVRLMWIKVADPGLAATLVKIERDRASDRPLLVSSLEASSAGIAALLRTGADSGTIKGFKPHASAFLGYIISHESHHRGQVLVALKGAGFGVPKTVAYGLWEWGSRAKELHDRQGTA